MLIVPCLGLVSMSPDVAGRQKPLTGVETFDSADGLRIALVGEPPR